MRGKEGLLFLLSVMMLGFSSLSSQVAGLRAILSITGGGELVVSISLAIWLIGHSFGNLIGILLIKQFSSIRLYIGSFLFTVFSIPLSIIFLFILKRPIGLLTGEVAGILDIMILSAVVLLPITVPFGIAFTSSATKDVRRNVKISFVYAFEAIGSIAGGLFAYMTIPISLNTLSLGIIATIGSLFALLFLYGYLKGFVKYSIISFSVVFGIFLIFLLGLGEVSNIYKYIRMNYTLPSYKIVEIEQTPYGEIACIERGGERIIMVNGAIVGSNVFTEVVEETAIMPFALSKGHSNVLIIGDALSGELDIIMKVKSVSNVKVPILDKGLIRFLGEYLNVIPKDRRCEIVNYDPRRFLLETKMKYDLIVQASPDPTTVEENRLFTKEFFNIVKSKLSLDGVFIMFASSDEHYISEDLAFYIKSLLITLESVFDNIVVFPGSRVIFVCSDTDYINGLNVEQIWKRICDFGLTPQFITVEGLSFRMIEQQRRILWDAIDMVKGDVNRDYRSIAYYYDLSYLASKTDPWLSSVLRRCKYFHPSIVMSSFILCLLALSFALRKYTTSPALMITLMGGISIMLELLLLVVYESVVGGLYRQLAIVFSVFMVGLSIGSMVSGFFDVRSWGMWLVSIIYILSGLFIILFGSLINSIDAYIIGFISISIIALVAVCTGLLFGFASDCFSNKGRWIGGLFRGGEMLGSTIASLASGLFVLPLIGLIDALLVLGIAIVVIGLIVIFVRWK
ncbi:MAG: hypothetical protein ACUVWP_08745 [bacterium]